MKVKIELDPAPRVIKRLGLSKDGDVQRFVTSDVMRRIQRYMPYRSGNMIKRMIANTNINKPEIVIPGPEARMLYFGKVMVDPKTGKAGFLTDDGWKSRKGVKKVVSSRDIEYTKTKNPLAGPYWERRMKAAEMNAISASVRRYIKTKKGG